jgi:hypothetical protein
VTLFPRLVSCGGFCRYGIRGRSEPLSAPKVRHVLGWRLSEARTAAVIRSGQLVGKGTAIRGRGVSVEVFS